MYDRKIKQANIYFGILIFTLCLPTKITFQSTLHNSNTSNFRMNHATVTFPKICSIPRSSP